MSAGNTNDDLDDMIRSGLRDLTQDMGDISPEDLADRLRDRDDHHRGQVTLEHRLARRLLLPAALIAILVIGAITAVWIWGQEQDREVATTTEPASENIFSNWGPGWHEIDPGPVIAPTGFLSVVEFHGSLFMVPDGLNLGSPPSGAGTDPSTEHPLWEFDPTVKEWSKAPTPPFKQFVLTAAGDHLVAVGTRDLVTQPVEWATWQWGDSEWADKGLATRETTVQGVGGLFSERQGSQSLVWTGERVLVPSISATLDPATGRTGVMAMPNGLDDGTFDYLSNDAAVLVGERVVLVGWSTKLGLSWNLVGGDLASVPGPAKASQETVLGPGSALVDGHLVALGPSGPDGSGTGVVMSYDPKTNTWSQAAKIPEPTSSLCPYSVASTGTDLMVRPCAINDFGSSRLGATFALRDDVWRVVGKPHYWSEVGFDFWRGLNGALVVWTATRSMGDPNASENPRIAVWVPPGPSKQPGYTTSTTSSPASTPACKLGGLPDLTTVLPEQFDIGPQPGLVGGAPEDQRSCYRNWGSSTDPGVHVTQGHDNAFTIGAPSRSGDFLWGAVHEGFSIEYQGKRPWSAVFYGISQSTFDSVVTKILANPTQFGTAGD